jgi:hypothetical protein
MSGTSPTNKTVNIYINAPSAQKTLIDLQARADKLTDSIRKGEAAGKDMGKAIDTLGNLKNKIIELDQIIAGNMAPSLQMVKNRATELRNELQKMSQDAPGYAAKFKEFEQVTQRFNQMRSEITNVSKSMDTAKSKMSEFWREVKTVAVGTFIGNVVQQILLSVAGYFSGIISGNAKISDSFTDIQKTTNLTASEVQKLNKELGQLDTRTKTAELREMAIGLGQIGEAANKANVENLDKIVVALGDEFGGGAREITTKLGVLRNNLDDIKTGNYGDDVLHIGNALNVLGAEGIATAPVITEFATRMAGIARTYKVTSGGILGISAAMQELGITSEVGSTAVNKLMTDIAGKTQQFADIIVKAGGNAKAFKDLVQNDMLGALLMVADAFAKTGDSNSAFATSLGDAGETGVRVAEVLAKLGKSQELVKEKIDRSTEALQQSDSILAEFGLKNTNLAAKVEKLEKVFNKLLTSPGVNNFLAGAVTFATAFVGILSVLINNLSPIFGLLTLYALGWAAANKEMIIQNAQLLYYNIRIGINTALLNIATAAQAAYTLGLSIMTRTFNVATPAIELFNLAVKSSPLGMLITLLGFTAAAVTVVYGVVTQHTAAIKEYTKAQLVNIEVDKIAQKSISDMKAKVGLLTAVINDNNASQENRLKALNELKALAPEHLSNLTLENIKYAEGKSLLEAFNQQLFKKAALEAAQGIQSDKLKKDLELQEAEYNLQQKISNKQTSIEDLSDEEKKYLGGARKKAPFTASVADALLGSNNSSAALEAITMVKAQRAKLANEIDATNQVVKERYEALGDTLTKGATATRIAYKEPGLSEADQKRLEELEARRKEFERKILALMAETEAAAESNDQKEIQSVKNKYATLVAEAEKLFSDKKRFSKNLLNLNKSEQQELETLYKKQADARSAKEYDDTLLKVKAHFDKEHKLIDDAYLNNEISKEAHGQKILALDEQEYDARALVAEDYAATVKKAETDAEKFKEGASKRRVQQKSKSDEISDTTKLSTAELNVAIAKKGSDLELEAKKVLLQTKFELESKALDKTSALYKLKQTELNKELAKLDKDYTLSKINNYLGIAQGMANILNTFLSAASTKDRAQLEEDNALNQKKKENLQKQLDAKKISQAHYNKEIEKLDDEKAKREHDLKVKEFNRNKAMALVQGAINLALSISKAWADWGGMPVAAAAIAAIDIAANAAAMAMIVGEEAPKYEYGRMPLGNGGIPQGARHSEGGINLVDSVTGKIVGNMEGGEGIISRDTVANNPELAHALINSSMYNGGKRIQAPWLYQNSAPLNYAQATENIQFNRMYSSAAMAGRMATTYHSNNSGTASVGFDATTLAALQTFSADMKKGVKASIYYNEWDKTNNEITSLRKASSANPYG